MPEHRSSDGTTLHYQVLGSGDQVITVLHSLALDGSWFVPMTEELDGAHRFLIPDFRGHGASGYGQQPVTLQALVDDVLALWDALGIESSAVAGISMGGMVAQGLAATAPDRVSALVLMATTGGYDETARTGALQRAAAARASGIEPLIEPTLQRWFPPAVADAAPALVDQARRQLLATDSDVHADFLAAMVDVGAFSALEKPPPTLVLGGEDDQSTPRPVIESLAEGIPGAELDFVAGGHLMAFSHPQTVAQRVTAFLGTHRLRGAI